MFDVNWGKVSFSREVWIRVNETISFSWTSLGWLLDGALMPCYVRSFNSLPWPWWWSSCVERLAMLGNPAYHENAVPKKMWSNHKASGVVFQEFPMTTAERGADRRSTESTGEVWRVGGLIVAALPVQRVFHPRLLCHLPMCEARVWGHPLCRLYRLRWSI